MFLTAALYVAMVYPCLECEAKFLYEDYLIHSSENVSLSDFVNSYVKDHMKNEKSSTAFLMF